ncbi:MAG: CAP domain-containing protein, partial [Bradymonadia bacterium]
SEESPSAKVVNAHMLHLLRRRDVSDATYWISIVRGKNVTAQNVLVDILPKLNRRFRPHRIGLAQKRVNGQEWVVTLIVHHAGVLNVQGAAPEFAGPIKVKGHVSSGYFQPKIVAAVVTGEIITMPVSLDDQRRFAVEMDQRKVGRLKRLELLAEHVSGPRVLNLLHVADASPLRPLPVIRMEKPSVLPNDRSLLKRIEALRSKQGHPPLVWSDELSVIAATHADVVADRQSLTHKAPREGHLRQRLSAANLFPRHMSELLVSAPSTLEALEAIRMSPAHYQQIQSNRFNQIGIGVKDQYYVVILAQFDPPTHEVD